MMRGFGLGRMMREGGADAEVKPLRITDRRMIGWFYRQLGPYWPQVLIGTVATLLATGAQLVPPRTIKPIVDEVITGQDYASLPRLITILILAYLAHQLFMSVRMAVMHILGQRFVYNLRLECYQHLQRLSLSYFDDHPTGDIMSRLSNDVTAVEDMVVHGVDQVLSNLLLAVGVIAILVANFQGRLIVVAAGLWPVPLFLAGIIIFSRYVRPIYRKIRDELGDINNELQESIAGVRVVKAFGREDHELERFRKRSWEYYVANARGIRWWSTFFPVLGFLTSMGTVTILWAGARQSGSGPLLTPGDVTMFLLYMGMFYGPVGMLIRVYDIFNRALAALARLFQILDETPEIEDAPEARELTDVRGEVLLENVSFKYKTGEEVLHDLTVHAAPGETVALVGRSGAGKTSLVNLIPRFYDPLAGRVLVDGQDVRKVTQRSLRRHIALVLQETFLFDGSVRDNIAYGRLDATDEEIVAAAKAAYAHEFIMELPDGYDTHIGERGVKLSGGQRQRIAIARAVLADPRILMLDEATSLVDTEAEQKIQAALDNLTLGRTVFVIAHRLSTVRKADKILVLEEGEIVEEDNHVNLMALGGLYAEMYQRQFQIGPMWEEEMGERDM
ncbi:MAG: ABC transporter ATP-binding protein [candidate division WS1 bacterium]|nr:ABC transporter ATP-binding protein [candidate division WS1 bacterium]